MSLIYKIFGVMLVVASTFMFGNAKADELKERILSLENLLSCMIQLENEIRFTQTPIKNALERICKNSICVNKEIINQVLNELENKSDIPVSEVWENAVNSNLNHIYHEDIEMYLLIGNSIGNSDLESQIKGINLINAKICENIKKASLRCDKNYKLYKNLGVYTGLLISVVLL